MRSEVEWLTRLRAAADIRVPEVYHADFSGELFPSAWFVMEKMPGDTLDKAKLTAREREQAAAWTAGMAAKIHSIRSDRFGYEQSGLFGDWYQALRAMAENALEDMARCKKTSKRGRKLIRYLDENRDVLAAAPCTMVNFDIWQPNILCSRNDNGLEFSLIDLERCFWGDPIADFVCLEAGKPLEKKQGSFEAYNKSADVPLNPGAHERIRYCAALGYLALVMEAEKHFRYSPLHFGWYRNMLASALMFSGALRRQKDKP